MSEKGGKPDSNHIPFWFTDSFTYGFVKTEKGLKMFTNWGFPRINLNDSTITLGARIKALRFKYGLKQEDLARSARVTLSVLAKYEQGQILDPNPWVLEKIAMALNTNPLKLLPLNNQTGINDLYDYFCRTGTPGNQIKKLRLKQHLQQKDLAKMLKVNRETIRRYEKDQSKPDKQIISKLEEILNIKP